MVVNSTGGLQYSFAADSSMKYSSSDRTPAMAPLSLTPIKQPSAIRIGKSDKGPGDFSCVGNLKFEIQLLVFTFSNQPVKVGIHIMA